MSKTVIATPWHNNKAIISLNNQTNIRGPLALVKSTCIDWNTGCQSKQLCTQGTGFYVRNSECTGFGIHRVILYVTSGKIPLAKQFVRIKENFGICKIRNRQITLYLKPVVIWRKPLNHITLFYGILYYKFHNMFHTFQQKMVNLDLAAKILIGDPNIDRTENAKFKSK